MGMFEIGCGGAILLLTAALIYLVVGGIAENMRKKREAKARAEYSKRWSTWGNMTDLRHR